MWCSGTTVPCMAKRSVALEVSSECGVVVELLLKGRDSMMALATLEMRELDTVLPQSSIQGKDK